MTTDGSVELVFASGETLNGQLVADGSGGMMLVADDGGQTAVVWATVSEIDPAAMRWSGDFAVGGMLATGNSETHGVTIEGDLVRDAHANRIRSKLRFALTDANGEQVANKTLVEVHYDHYLTRRAYLHVTELLINDKFRDLDVRSVTTAGIGYKLVTRSNFQVDAEAGLSYLAERFITAPNEDRPTLQAAVNATWTDGRLTLANDFVIHPSLEDTQFFLVDHATIDAALSGSWDLTLSALIQHDNEPSAAVEQTDVQWLAGGRYSF